MIALDSFTRDVPLVAILRGLTPDLAADIGKVLYEEGFRCIEVPLNSPQPLDSIEKMRAALPDDCLIGAGTVMSPENVKQVAAAGGRLIVMPHSDPDVIRAAKADKLLCLPGVATPTEAFAALKNGADAVKLFPAEQMPPEVVKAWRAVMPKTIGLFPVGGISVERMAVYWAAGASGFGLGSALYSPGTTAAEIRPRAKAFVAGIKALMA